MTVPYRKTFVDDAMKARTLELLDVGLPSYGGEDIEGFEVELAERCGVRYGVATNSGTSALHLILLAAGVGPGDEVILGANDYIGCLSAIAAVGAAPVFVDSLRATANLDTSLVAAHVTPRTKAVIATHLYGHPCDLDPLLEVTRPRGVHVIEDFAHALNARYRGRPVGSSGLAGFCSFSGKHITVFGPGGIAVTDDVDFAEAMSSLRDQGRNREFRRSFVRRRDESWYDQERIGLNLHMPETSAAIGRAQLRYVDAWHRHRRSVAATYDARFAGLPLELPTEAAGVEHSYLHYTLKTPARDALRDHLAEAGFETQVHYPRALHQLEPVRRRWPQPGSHFPVAEGVADHVLSLPVGPHLEPHDVDRLADEVVAFFDARS